MTDQIGLNVASMGELEQGFGQMSDQTVEANEATRKLMEGVQDECQGISDQMQTAFTDLATAVRDNATAVTNRLAGTDWVGSSQEKMADYENQVNGSVNNFMTSSETGVADFKTSLMNFITEFYGVIQGEYSTAMNDISGKYTDAQAAAATTRENIVNADATSISLS